MTLEGAIILNETNDYIIYTVNSVTTSQYGVVVPKNINGTLNMLVDLHMKSSFDGVGNGTKTREQLIEEIGSEYNKLKGKYNYGMLVIPMIDEVMFQSIVLNGDKQKMFDEVKKIGAITSELYKKLTDSGVDKQRIDQKIIIVEKNNEDEKFVVWLKEQMPNFVDGILYSELNVSNEVVNPFVNNNSIFGSVTPQTEVSKVEPSVSVGNGGVFNNVTPVTPVDSVVASTPVEPVISTPVGNVTPVVNPTVTPAVDVFGVPTNVQSAPVGSVANQSTVVATDPVVPVEPVVEGPKPVGNATLEATSAFAPIQSQADVNNEEEVNVKKGSKGFVNLAILLVVLIGVTIISIELGKYLYSVYGA